MAALGLFDGVHTAHRALLEKAAALGADGLVPCAFTFDTGSMGPLYKADQKPLISQAEKLRLMGEIGIAAVYSPQFAKISNMGPEEFFDSVLIKILSAKRLVCGYNFHFAKGALAGIRELQRLCDAKGVSLTIFPRFEMDGETVSSSAIRKHLLAGEVEEANRLLGRPFAVQKSVVIGNRIGRRLGFPTVNQAMGEPELVPRHGVYASVTSFEGGRFRSITNIGAKPTVTDNGQIFAETHLFGFGGDLYGKEITVELMSFLRDEKKFADVTALKEQIAKDIKKAEAFFDV